PRLFPGRGRLLAAGRAGLASGAHARGRAPRDGHRAAFPRRVRLIRFGRSEPEAVRHAATTPLMLIGWCLLDWGTFLDLAFVWSLVTEGAAAATEAWGRLSPANAVASVAAALAWSYLGLSAGVSRRARRDRSDTAA